MSIKDFQVISKLGEGAFSSVFKVKRISDGQEYAMKKVKLTPLSEKEKQNALNEVRILASIKNPCIIGYKEAFFEDSPLSLCIVMEHAGGGDILNKISQHQKARTSFKEEDIWRYAIQMIYGLKTLHDMKILHRDLKCANVFLSTDGKIAKLGDLNVSKVAKSNLVYTQTGTPYYASPEVWRDQPYDLKSDIWSLGCVIYEMCAQKPPFRANDMGGLYKKIQRGIFDRIPSQYSIDLYNLISMCLQVKPQLRPNCDQLLGHPVVQKNAGKFIEEYATGAGAEDFNELLATIKLPANIKAIAQKLPKANYSQDVEERGRPETNLKAQDQKMKRPISQNAPITKNAIFIRESQSRESRISQMQKLNPIPVIKEENEKEYLVRMQKEYVDRAKVIKPTELPKDSPKKVENLGNQKSPNYRILNGKRVMENIKEEVSKNDERMINNNPRPKVLEPRKVNDENNKNAENIMPPIKVRPTSKDKNMDDIPLSNRQEYLINKYQNRENKIDEKKVLPKVGSEKDHILIRRAEYLLEKYQAVDPVKKENGVARQAGGQIAVQKKEAQDILDKYANIFNQKEANGQVRPSYLNQNNVQQTPAKNLRQNSDGNNGNNGNPIRQQAHLKVGAARPMWWG